MNSDIERFFNKNGINPDEISASIAGRIQDPKEVNYIVAQHYFHKPYERRLISIADIVGYNYRWSGINPFIAYSLDSFFNSKGDGYHSRSVGLLNYTADNCIEKIDFEWEPMVVDEMGDNKYVISTNGLHRYTVLRVLYLSECLKANGNKEELARLREKYTIPVTLKGVDLFKTYSKYLLISSPCGVKDIEKEYDRDKWEYTGRLIIITNDNEQIIINSDQELLDYVSSHASIINSNIDTLQWGYNKYPSFRIFLEEYYSKCLDVDKLKEKFYESQKEGGIEQC